MMKLKIMAAMAFFSLMTIYGEAADLMADVGQMAKISAAADIGSEKNDSILSAVWDGIYQEDASPFLQEVKLPKNTAFTTVEGAEKLGLLTVTEKGNSVPALVLHCEFIPVVGKDAMKDAFEASRLSPKSVSELYSYNVALLEMENKLNDMFLEMTKRLNEMPRTDPKIPFNMMGVDFIHVEQIHRAQDMPRIYTSGVRAVFFFDGFAIPLYAKGYAMKYGDKYRFFSVLTTDSANEMVKEAADRIAAASAK